MRLKQENKECHLVFTSWITLSVWFLFFPYSNCFWTNLSFNCCCYLLYDLSHVKHQYQFIIHTSNLGKEKIQAIDHASIIFLIFSFSPFSIVLNKYFRNFVHELNPEYRLLDRKTLNKLLWLLYDEFKENSIKYFKTIKWVHSTCDTWTSCSNNNYLGVTLHFLNDFYELKSFTLSL